jgi:hypothetical protein
MFRPAIRHLPDPEQCEGAVVVSLCAAVLTKGLEGDSITEHNNAQFCCPFAHCIPINNLPNGDFVARTCSVVLLRSEMFHKCKTLLNIFCAYSIDQSQSLLGSLSCFLVEVQLAFADMQLAAVGSSFIRGASQVSCFVGNVSVFTDCLFRTCHAHLKGSTHTTAGVPTATICTSTTQHRTVPAGSKV